MPEPRIHAIRSIPLSRRTYVAWRSAGVHFLPRALDYMASATLDAFPILLNLGNSQLPSELNCWNPAPLVRKLSSPALSRELLNSLLPPADPASDCWVKGPGRGGRNKSRHEQGFDGILPQGYDIQRHIEGSEYRVNTVKNRVVQVHERVLSNSKTKYYWRGVKNTPKAVKNVAHQAAERAGPRTVLGHDIRHGPEGTYLLESNTCPGVNYFTAQRIVKLLLQE